jgi:hypothetical protein
METNIPGTSVPSRDLVVGVMSNYDYHKIEPWIVSLKRSGFTGDIAMICFNVNANTIRKLAAQGVEIYAYGQDSAGNTVFNSSRAVVVDRFRALYEFGIHADWKNRYRYIVTTDVKDVIFQSDPIKFLEKHAEDGKKINVGSECLEYADEPWGNENMFNSYPKFVYDNMKTKTIYNCGTISGSMAEMHDLFLAIYLLSIGSPVYNPDQAAINILLNMKPWSTITRFCDMQSGYAVQLGTTADPNKLESFRPNLLEHKLPYLHPEGDGIVRVSHNDGEDKIIPSIVHQYDRIPSWNKIIDAKYRE